MWVYAIGALSLSAAILTLGDRWWFATLLLFSPRWLLTVPLLALVPLAIFYRRRLLWPLLLVAGILLGPVLNFSLPLSALGRSDGQPLRVLTCNLSVGDAVASERMFSLIEEVHPDLVALQEAPRIATKWPDGWHVIAEGELLIASRYPLARLGRDRALQLPHTYPRGTILHGIVQLPTGPLTFVNLHLPSPRRGLAELLDRSTILAPSRRGALEVIMERRSTVSTEIIEEIDGIGGNVLVAGDLNLTTESAIYRRDWARYSNAFSRAGLGPGWTLWAKLQGLSFGVRVDHILMGEGWQARRAWVGPDIGSEHRPLVTDLLWTN